MDVKIRRPKFDVHDRKGECNMRKSLIKFVVLFLVLLLSVCHVYLSALEKMYHPAKGEIAH